MTVAARSRSRLLRGAVVSLLLGAACHRSEQPVVYPDPVARFANYTRTCGDIPRDRGGIPGEIPGSITASLPPDVVDGLCTWYFWQGGDPASFNGRPDTGGNPHFWRALERKTAAIEEKTGQRVTFTLLRFIDSRKRTERFRTLGAMNDPGCTQSTTADAYGLYLDRCADPYASGVIGIRLSPNPTFDPKHWDAAAYFEDPRKYEPPYLAGLTCGSCHIAFNPLRPPADAEQPRWENLAGAIGNQYLLEGKMFEGSMTPGDFLWHVYARQQPGTSDTSRLSVDWIDNPNAINPIFMIDSVRPRHVETMNDGTTAAVPHVLKDGADSIGAAGAAMRVYVNIGTCSAMRMAAEDVLLGTEKDQRPFVITEANERCQDWQQTVARIPNAAKFLDAQRGFPLRSIENGRFVSGDQNQLAMGRRAFAENCARCHSSKIPDGLDVVTKHDRANAAKWVALVERPDFLENNFLSDDLRYPVVDPDWHFAIGTNLKRAVATNAEPGHIWNDFSSRTYKELPSPGSATLYNPIDPAHPIAFRIPPGRGYYRVPSLIAVWATAPLLHNNSLGAPTQDPSIEGRLRAFEDAMDRMFHPAKRDGVKSIKRTTQPSELRLGAIHVRIPQGTPVDLLANIDLRALVREKRETLVHGALAVLEDPSKAHLASELLALNTAPDFIEDHGHEFGSRLPPDRQRALIEYMKTF